jgi:hypothetical protein
MPVKPCEGSRIGIRVAPREGRHRQAAARCVRQPRFATARPDELTPWCTAMRGFSRERAVRVLTASASRNTARFCDLAGSDRAPVERLALITAGARRERDLGGGRGLCAAGVEHLVRVCRALDRGRRLSKPSRSALKVAPHLPPSCPDAARPRTASISPCHRVEPAHPDRAIRRAEQNDRSDDPYRQRDRGTCLPARHRTPADNRPARCRHGGTHAAQNRLSGKVKAQRRTCRSCRRRSRPSSWASRPRSRP